MKTCNKCGEEKPFEGFAKRAEATDGHRGACYECQRKAAIARREDPEYRAKWAAYYAEYNNKRKADGSSARYQKKYYAENQDMKINNARLWYRENKEKAAQTSKEYREAHKEAIRERAKEYCANNVDQIKEYRKKYYKKNRKDKIEYTRQWYLANTERANESSRRYREENRPELMAQQREAYHKKMANPEAREEENRNRREAYKAFPELRNLRNQKSKRYRAKLTDATIRHSLKQTTGVKNPPQELIEAKRVQLRITRALKEMVKTPAN